MALHLSTKWCNTKLMNFDDLRKNWDSFARNEPMRSILWRQEPWATDEFFQSGREQFADSLAHLAKLGLDPSGRALDFGCGLGRLTQAMAEHFVEVVGVDISAFMIEQAKESNHFPETCHYVTNVTDDLSQFGDASFDFIYTVIVLQHVGSDNAQRYIAEFMRILRPSGVALFQVPSELVLATPLQSDAMRASLSINSPGDLADSCVPRCVTAGTLLRLIIRICNQSDTVWNTEHRVICVGQWYRSPDRIAVDDLGPRVFLDCTLQPGNYVDLPLEVVAPKRPGDYILRFGLIQMGIADFVDYGLDALEILISATVPDHSTEEESGTPSLSAEETESPHMEMHPVPRQQVIDIVSRMGAEIVAIDDDYSAGPEWRSYFYTVKKPAALPKPKVISSLRSVLERRRVR